MDFTEGNISKKILLFSIPLILGNLFQQLYTLVNSAFVGNYLGVNQLAAVGSCYPVVFFITSMVLGIGTGGSVVVSHYYGAKDFKSIHSIIGTFYIFFIILGAVICLLSIVFADLIFEFLGMEDAVRVYATEYFRIYMVGMFFSVLFHSAVSMLRGMGDSLTQLYFLIPANILNGLLSYIFLGVMHWGVGASAMASLISQFIAFISIFVYLHRNHEYIRLPFRNITFSKSYLKQIIGIGVPTGIQQSVVSLTQILILWLVVGFGTNATAAYSAAMRIESIALLFVLNISQSLTSFTGMNTGAGKFDRAQKGFIASLKIMGWLSAVTMVIFCCFNTQLMGLFTTNDEVIAIGNEYLKVSGWFWFLFCWQMMYTAFFRGAGKATVTMLISIFSLWIVRYPVSYYLSLKFGTMGIWLGAPVAWLTGVVIYFAFFKTKIWHNQSLVKSLTVLFTISFTLFSCNTKAQEENVTTDEALQIKSEYSKYPKDAFISPLKIPLTLAGTFAELRGSHFHSGLDIRTNERTGYNVYASADGYVSRIKVQAYGGGKNLYITHPNGYTTVYMHLDSYYGKIGEFVKAYQYQNKCYTFDYTFSKPEIYVKQGEIIAISGETGMVQGPHLHFEIRDSKTEQPINPLLFGLDVKDTVRPYIVSLAVTPEKNSTVEFKHSTKTFKPKNDKSLQNAVSHPSNVVSRTQNVVSRSPNDVLSEQNDNTVLQTFDTVNCYGDVYFSILAYDPSYHSTMRNGVWKTELFVDGELQFSHHIERFSFSDYGYVDATINYPLYITTGQRYLSSKCLSNGKLPFNTYKNRGILNVKVDSVYKIQWKMTDLRNNSYTYTYFVKGVFDSAAFNSQNNRKQTGVKQFQYTSDNSYTTSDGSSFYFPKGCLYENIDFNYSSSKGIYSDIHKLHTVYEPVKKKYTVKIKPYKIIPSLKNKYLVVKINSNNSKKSVGGQLKDGYVETTVKEFGKFTVWIDTIAPTVKALNFKSHKAIAKHQKTLKVSISDNLSGVDTYNGYLNGEWVLMEFDGRRATLTYTIDDKLKKGSNDLKIVVTDAKNNKKEVHFTVICNHTMPK